MVLGRVDFANKNNDIKLCAVFMMGQLNALLICLHTQFVLCIARLIIIFSDTQSPSNPPPSPPILSTLKHANHKLYN